MPRSAEINDFSRFRMLHMLQRVRG
jgi:putative transcriptional regulator